MIKPTSDDLIGDAVEELESVQRKADDSWRHGCHIEEVFHRKSDDTYWLTNYDLSSDGETHGLRDDCYSICQVNRVEVPTVVIRFDPVEKE